MSRTPESLALDERIIRMYIDDGLSLAQVAEEIGVSRQAVAGRLERANVPRRPKDHPYPHRTTPAEIVTMIDAMAAAGARVAAIADALAKKTGISVGTAYKYSSQRRRELREEKHRKAIELYEIHKSTYVVGEILGVSDMTIWNWLRKAGVNTSDKRAYSAKTKARALKLRARGIPQTEVAEYLGCSASAVSFWEQEANGVKRERTDWAKNLDYQLARRRKNAAKMRREAAKRDRDAIVAARKALR